VLCSRIRIEEKLIFKALRERGVDFEKLDIRKVFFELGGGRGKGELENWGLENWGLGKQGSGGAKPSTSHPQPPISQSPNHQSPISQSPVPQSPIPHLSTILIRCISHREALYASRILESLGVRTVNSFEAIHTAGDKLLTTLALMEHGVPTLPAAIALTPQAAFKALEDIGYPSVLKPVHGSWGRLLARVDNPTVAEAILEHRSFMGDGFNSAFYIQQYVEKPGRDIRVLVVGDEVVYAIYRYSSHWITNTARGGKAEVCPLTPELEELALKAARAVGGGILAIDIFEMPDGSLVVNEVNHTPEFHGAMEVVEVDIAGKMVEYVGKLPDAHSAFFYNPQVPLYFFWLQ